MKLFFRNNFNISPQVPVVSFIARFDDVKNPLLVGAVAEELTKFIPETIFIMAGGGHLLDETKKLVFKKKLSKNFRFMDFQNDVRKILSITKVLVMPSLSESFGLMAAEAMAMGIPVVVSDTGGLKELVRNGIDGYHCQVNNIKEFTERIKELILNQKKIDAFGKSARDRIVKVFPITQTVDNFEKLLINL